MVRTLNVRKKMGIMKTVKLRKKAGMMRVWLTVEKRKEASDFKIAKKETDFTDIMCNVIKHLLPFIHLFVATKKLTEEINFSVQIFS
jgi:hypothetical protein